MPIVRVEGKAVLRCINHDIAAGDHPESMLEKGTTMRNAGHPWFGSELTAFVCKSCGYTELYLKDLPKRNGGRQ